LLDSLADNHHGATTYVTPEQAIDEAVSGFYAKVSTPVLTDLELDFGDIVTYDIYPDPLPDLFAGTQLVLVGRYRRSGITDVLLSGEVDGRIQTFDYREQVFRRFGGPDFLPRLWATRKIGALLNQVRLKGPEQELVDQIVKLSIRYGIVTPYTSYLVTEPMALSREAQEGIAQDAFNKMLMTPSAVSGEEAVGRAAAESEFRAAEVPMELSGEAANVVRIAGAKTFRLVDGVWIDTAFDPDRMTTTKVPVLSDDYFELADALPAVGDAFALGEQVIILVGDEAYEVVGDEEAGDPIIIPEPTRNEASDDMPEVVSPEIVITEPEEHEDFSLPCPGFSFVIGLVAIPLSRRKR
jgi:Ca-activated chloride channel family protein